MQTIELPSLNLQKAIKSMQMFRKPVQRIEQGDRAGMMVRFSKCFVNEILNIAPLFTRTEISLLAKHSQSGHT